MVETADLAFAVFIQISTANIHIMEGTMRCSDHQSEYQHQSNETVFFCVSVECFAQYSATIPLMCNT